MATSSAREVPIGPEPRPYQRIHLALRRRIVQGGISPGTALLEVHVAEEFAVSRGPARRALVELEREGLVAKASGRGFLVTWASAPPAGGPIAMAAGEALTSTASWERIYRHIARELAAYAALGRWRLTEVDLARHFRVSRTVAREVLAQLQTVGIVRKDAKSRWYVPALTPQRINEFYELRWTLEPAAMRKAALRAPRALIGGMRRELEDAAARFPDVSPDELNALEHRLHVEFLSHCGNQTLIETLQHYHALLIAHSFLYAHSQTAEDTDPFLSEHLAVLRELDRGDLDAAAQALERHLRNSAGRAVDRVASVRGILQPAPLPYLRKSDHE